MSLRYLACTGALLSLVACGLDHDGTADVNDASLPDGEVADAPYEGATDAPAKVDGGIDTGTLEASVGDSDPEPAPGIVAFAPDPSQRDLVGRGDDAIGPDGVPDGTFTATLEGPITGLALVTIGANGATIPWIEWDTLVENDVIASVIGAGFTTGSQTWILGVFDGSTVQNDANGRIALAAGKHEVTLAASEAGGQFQTGRRFKLLARIGDATGSGEEGGSEVWVSSQVVTWP